MPRVSSAQLERCQKILTLFERLGKNISIKGFEDRLEFQKIVYLAQQYGIDFGYSFSWYLKGPYSKTGAKDGYTICENLKSNQKLISVQKTKLDEKNLEKFRDIISPHMDDPIWLEIAASLIYLREETYGDNPLDQIIGYLIEDLTSGYKNFDEEKVRKVLSDLVRIRLLK